jgi:hypothetical protein
MKRLYIILEDLSKLTGIDLKLDYNSKYGGYRLLKEDGTGVFGYSSHDKRISSGRMEIRLIAIINGIIYTNSLKINRLKVNKRKL